VHAQCHIKSTDVCESRLFEFSIFSPNLARNRILVLHQLLLLVVFTVTSTYLTLDYTVSVECSTNLTRIALRSASIVVSTDHIAGDLIAWVRCVAECIGCDVERSVLQDFRRRNRTFEMTPKHNRKTLAHLYTRADVARVR